MKNSRSTTTLSQTIRIPKGWAERGETIIRTISKQHTGGATEKKDQPGWDDLGRANTTALDITARLLKTARPNFPRVTKAASQRPTGRGKGLRLTGIATIAKTLAQTYARQLTNDLSESTLEIAAYIRGTAPCVSNLM